MAMTALILVAIAATSCAAPETVVKNGVDLTAARAAISANESLAGTPPYRRLFLDATTVEDSAGLTRTFHAAVKSAENPLISKDRPWEGSGPYLYGTVLRVGKGLRMWYQVIGSGDADVCYATSLDGIHWTKPDLGIVSRGGFGKNNIVAPAGKIHIASVIPMRDNSDSDQKWAMFGYTGENGASVFYSPDGLHWDWDAEPRQAKLFSSSDVTNFFYDPYQRRYVATYKTANRRHRAVGVAFSGDGLIWSKPVEGAVFGADDLDPDATQVYGMPVFPYQGLYIGLPWIYHARWIKYGRYTSPSVMYEAQEGSPRTVDVQMAWSHNMLSWNRPPGRAPFIPLGRKGAFDSGMIFTARAPVIMGDQLFFYYGGWDAIHDAPNAHAGIGLATLRLDGFCSMKAGKKEGWLISRREVFNTPRVQINACCAPGGYIAAELLDRENRVIPGFSRDECIPFSGDSTRHEISWHTTTFPTSMRDKDKKIRFFIRSADLYSYLPIDINTAIDNGSHD